MTKKKAKEKILPNPDRAMPRKRGEPEPLPMPMSVCPFCQKYNGSREGFDHVPSTWWCIDVVSGQHGACKEEKKAKFSVEVRMIPGTFDEVMLQTENFRDALCSYENLKTRLEQERCDYDMVLLYVWAGDCGLKEYVPVVASSLETTISVSEW